MEIPENVDAERVEAQRFDCEQSVLPILPGDAGEMDLAGLDGREVEDVGYLHIRRGCFWYGLDDLLGLGRLQL